MNIQSGQIKNNAGRSGFILTDSGEDLFVLPRQCVGFGCEIPPLGTRVQFTIGLDPKKGAPLAENVEPEHSVVEPLPVEGSGQAGSGDLQQLVGLGLHAGTVKSTKENHGFILQDSGERDIFFMPLSCEAFGGVCPAVGTRVVYEIVTDSRTGRPRAENILPDITAEDLFMSLGSGHIKKNAGRSGFIQTDSGEDLFVLPKQCAAFGSEIPPVGTRVQFTIGVDPQKGAPLAENVEPEQSISDLGQRKRPAPEAVASLGKKIRKDNVPQVAGSSLQQPGSLRLHAGMVKESKVQPKDVVYYESESPLTLSHSGQIKKNAGRSGFILTDSGEDLFLLPKQCVGFGSEIPPVGTRVQFTIGTDPQKGAPLAENVEPEQSIKGSRQGKGSQAMSSSLQQPMDHGWHAGTVKQNKGNHGFILQDNGERDIFFMPLQCEAFGGVCPDPLTRVVYTVVIDGKTGRPRAENVQPEDAAVDQSVSSPMISHSDQAADYHAGQVKKNFGRSGFIQTDSGEDLFVLPKQCVGFGSEIPPVGTRVQFTVGLDPQKGAPLAENVEPEQSAMALRPASGSQKASSSLQQRAGLGLHAGTVKTAKENHGFILQDSGERDIFFMPLSCEAFGGLTPPVGTRVVYEIVTDSKTGRPRAENIIPERMAADQSMSPGLQSGQIKKNAGRSGFIQTDSGEDLFVLPKQCVGFGSEIPPVGTRVQFTIGTDPQKGAPLAENVEPQQSISDSGLVEDVESEQSFNEPEQSLHDLGQ